MTTPNTGNTQAPPRAPLPPQPDDVVVSAGKQFAKCPEGVTPGVCCDWIYLGQREQKYQGNVKMVEKVRLLFMVNEVDPETGKRFVVGQTFTKSLGENAHLRKFIDAWRGKPLTEDEARAFSLNTLLGVPGLCSVAHRKGNDQRTYVDVMTVTRLVKGMERPTIDPEYVRVRDRKPEEQTGATVAGGPPGAPHPADFEPEGVEPDIDDDLPF